MPRVFNTAGPCRHADHYMLPPERRLGATRELIGLKAFFVVHAPRQTGKTTSLQALARSLTDEGEHAALLASCKPAAISGDDISFGMNALIGAIDKAAAHELPAELRPAPSEGFSTGTPANKLELYLTRWCESCPRPVVLFLDEIDALQGRSLLSALDQLHSGYSSRPAPFPSSLALIGLRDVRDYRIGDDGQRLGTSSPFNIKLESLRMRDFTEDEVAELYAQHTEETGQRFSNEATALAFRLTRGQPWLVNSLARQMTTVEAADRSATITAQHVHTAKEALIRRRDTHIDSLVDRLRDARVRRVIEPMLAGQLPSEEVLDDDLQLVTDLGLIARGKNGLEVANPIYHEIVPRALASVTEAFLPVQREPHIAADGRLRFDSALEGFASFWRLHAEHFLTRQPYSEAAAQLIFMAYLQRIVNGGSPVGMAMIDREYAVGSGRIDLCLRWPLPSGELQQIAIELKVWRDRAPDPIEEGIEQLTGYLQRLGLDEGTLMIFDRRGDAPALPSRITRQHSVTMGLKLTIWRL